MNWSWLIGSFSIESGSADCACEIEHTLASVARLNAAMTAKAFVGLFLRMVVCLNFLYPRVPRISQVQKVLAVECQALIWRSPPSKSTIPLAFAWIRGESSKRA